MTNDRNKKRVIVVGGGFGGMHTVKSLRRADVNVTLIDRRNFHLFQPLLYQVATGGLSPANIASPLRAIFSRQRNVDIVMGEVVTVDPENRTVNVHTVEPGEVAVQVSTMPYDWLIVAAGSTHSYFGHDDWEEIAPGLKTIEDATEIRGRIFAAFEAAEQETDSQRRKELMTFVIVGGGPTGVELAGAVAELSRHTLRNDFRNINPPDAKIIIVDGQERVLANFTPKLSHKAETSLRRLGIELQTGTIVSKIDGYQVHLTTGGVESTIGARTVLWAAGVAAVPLGRQLATAANIETDRAGRVPVETDLSIKGFREIFVIGDIASCKDENGKPLPGVAQVAIQQGKYVGRLIAGQLRGKAKPGAFRYRDKGSLATIGRRSAVADLGKLKFSGFFAWLLWLFVHIMSLAQFQNRVLVFFQWAWSYCTFNRSARLITERNGEIPAEKPDSTNQVDD